MNQKITMNGFLSQTITIIQLSLEGNGNYEGVRALIGGINNHLLFITYYENNIKNGQGQEIIKTNKQNDQMLLFYLKTGLSIEYNEDKNNFNFINYLFVIILHHSVHMHTCISMTSFSFLVDIIVTFVQNYYTSIQFEKINRLNLKTIYTVHCINFTFHIDVK
ncbi:hypothetical protein RFI_11315 [Reticulomyxa filosa]|uniref:Uncharacterized protein n=1 Tax=Reticulomyxa filosa TaxID=46433 RepID=X6NJA6_RETFI|nr:hypothetical protein RFI_11315 [Reticulomyxa filosa]|eukprot:ETO25824.1 hypothetical protein RFI_11315 [Reticulomyxa filosa]